VQSQNARRSAATGTTTAALPNRTVTNAPQAAPMAKLRQIEAKISACREASGSFGVVRPARRKPPATLSNMATRHLVSGATTSAERGGSCGDLKNG
jgi:hypothetical protein